MLYGMQKTLARDVVVEGVGLHSGARARLVLRPAPAGSGVVFARTDMNGAEVPALWNHVVDTRLCTVLARGEARVGTVEHLMAALAGLGVDNVRAEIDGPEVPVMDGSSAPFVAAIERAGVVAQRAQRNFIKVTRRVRVENGASVAVLTPAAVPHFACTIDFDHGAIGRQRATLTPGRFAQDLADCRTFGFAHEVEAMRAAGLARGGSLDNAVVLDEVGVMNPGGLRRADEFARHKLLDAVGDMALAGGPLLASYEADRPSHALNNALLRALSADRDAWEIAPLYAPPSEVLLCTKRAAQQV